MPHTQKTPKGFTMVELLIMIFMIALLGTVALSSYMNSAGAFRFISAYKQMRSSFDVARGYAMTNRLEKGVVPDRYGVCVTERSVVIFADVGEKPMQFDPEDAEVAGCTSSREQNGQTDFDSVLSHYEFDNYKIEAFEYEIDEQLELLTGDQFVLIFYEIDGTVSVVHNNDNRLSTDNFEFFLRFKEEDRDRFSRSIKIHLLTGLADEIQ